MHLVGLAHVYDIFFVVGEAYYIENVALDNKYDCFLFATINCFYNQYIKNKGTLYLLQNKLNKRVVLRNY